jgi:hypothetical protein
LSFHPAILVLGFCTEDIPSTTQKCICTTLFVAALFVKYWENLNEYTKESG